MSKLKAIIEKFPLRRETYFDMELPTLRRVLNLEAIDNRPYVWVLYQADNGARWGAETVHVAMLCEGQKLDSDITELEYWGSLTFFEEDHQLTHCHYFTYRKEAVFYGTGQRNQRSSPEHRLRVA